MNEYLGKELRKNAAIVSAAATGVEVRHAIVDSLVILAEAAEEKEIPLSKHKSLAYRNGILTGLGIVILIILIIEIMLKIL